MKKPSFNKLGTEQNELDKSYHPEHAAALRELATFRPDYFNVISDFGLDNLWQRPGLTPREK